PRLLLQGRRTAPHDRSDLLVREPFLEAERNDLALARGEAAHGRAHRLDVEPQLERAGRPGLALGRLLRLVERGRAPHRAVAARVEREVARDPEQPGAERRAPGDVALAR